MENKPPNLTEYATTYSQLRPFWIDCLNLKEPLPGTLTQYLCKYTKEDDIEFSERVKRLAQLNLVDIISDIYLSMLFSTTVQIDSENHQDEVDAFVANCNAQGDGLVDWFREVVGPNALTYGVCDVFVDLPSAKTDIASLDQQRQAGVDQPYCYVVPPLNRVNWTLDDAIRQQHQQDSPDGYDDPHQSGAVVQPSNPHDQALEQVDEAGCGNGVKDTRYRSSRSWCDGSLGHQLQL
jgi:hypothetical protein